VIIFDRIFYLKGAPFSKGLCASPFVCTMNTIIDSGEPE